VAIQKIVANSVNEGLRIIREELGPDAMIMKTVKRNKQVELFVDSPNLLSESKKEREVPNKAIHAEFRKAKFKMLSSLGELSTEDMSAEGQPSLVTSNEAPRGVESEYSPRDPHDKGYQQSTYQEEKRIPLSPKTENSFDSILGNIKKLDPSNDNFNKEKTVDTILAKLKLDAGISAEVRACRRLDELIDNMGGKISIDEIPAQGIRAFVGPAGSGKTTCLIKIITRHVLQFGSASCAIVNCDRYRVGAKEQLIRMGELLDVQVINTTGEFTLDQALTKVAHRNLVLINMPGLGMTDPLLRGELFKLNNANYDIARYLVLPANYQEADMAKALSVYGGHARTSAIFTHLDECSGLGATLNFLIKNKVQLAYISDGAHIPEDISRPGGIDLVRLAISLADPSLASAMSVEAPKVAKAGFTDFTDKGKARKGISEMVMDV
jgi:flagellar biosynthesis protein FlhF